MKTKQLFFNPYKNLDNAYLDAAHYAKQQNITVHIIKTDRGFEIVPVTFISGSTNAILIEIITP
jgi:hypothetical protein